MPAIVRRGEVVNLLNPKLLWYGISRGGFRAGRLTDPIDLEYEIVKLTDDTLYVDPEVVVARTAVDLVTERAGIGRFMPTYTIPADATIGRWAIRYYYTFDGGVERGEQMEFDVIENINPFSPPFYCTPSDLREDGITGTDAQLLQRIAIASRLIDMYTGRFFDPRYQEMNLNGNGSRAMQFDHPLLGLEAVEYEASMLPSSGFYDDDVIRISEDRNNPKIELFYDDGITRAASSLFFSDLNFPLGRQNILIRGVFGFTDPGGPLVGETPMLIRYLTRRMIARDSSGGTCGIGDKDAWRILKTQVRDQSIEFQAPRKFGPQLLGDPELDSIILMFMRPPNLGAA